MIKNILTFIVIVMILIGLSNYVCGTNYDINEISKTCGYKISETVHSFVDGYKSYNK